MASGKVVTKTVILNNVKATTVVKTIELVVVNDQLVPDQKLVEPGVNSIYQ